MITISTCASDDLKANIVKMYVATVTNASRLQWNDEKRVTKSASKDHRKSCSALCLLQFGGHTFSQAAKADMTKSANEVDPHASARTGAA